MSELQVIWDLFNNKKFGDLESWREEWPFNVHIMLIVQTEKECRQLTEIEREVAVVLTILPKEINSKRIRSD